jgi:RsiW-degrading membrane proteinase PrsW (M82 family)
LSQAIASTDTSRNSLLMVAAGGLISGILTPLLPALIDHIVGSPGQFRISLIAVPFALLVFILVRRFGAKPWWAAALAALITMVAFVCAVNAAIFIEGQTAGAATAMRYLLAGLTGGLVGAGLMALGIGLLPAGPRTVAAWWPMLITGTLAGTLLALDNTLGLDRISLLYPVWQAGVAVRLVMALRF